MRLAGLAAVLAAAVPESAGALTTVSLSTVVLQGTAAPDLPEVVLSNLQAIGIGNGGHVVFGSFLTGDGVTTTNRDAMFRWNPDGTTELLARRDALLPDSSGLVLDSWNFHPGAPPSVDAVGGVVLNNGAHVRDAGGTVWNAMLGPVGGEPLAVIARSGDAAPGTPLVFQDQMGSQTYIGDGGQTVWRARLSDGSVGLWSSDGQGNTELVARQGMQAPGVEAGVSFGIPALRDVDAGGRAILYSRLVGAGITSANDDSVWLYDAGSLVPLVREGDPVPGLPAGTVVGAPFGLPDGGFALDGDRVLISAAISGPGVTTANDSALFFGPSDAPFDLIFREGDPAPGIEPGATFGSGSAILDGEGRGVVLAYVFQPDSSFAYSVWRRDAGGDLSLVARNGDPVPGLAGVTFLEIQGFGMDGNVFGDIVFRSSLGNTPGTRDQAIFVSLANGELLRIAREGDVIEVAPGDFRTIVELEEFFGIERLNDRRELVFGVRFSGGSRAILRASIPEPPEAALLLTGLAVAAARARRLLPR